MQPSTAQSYLDQTVLQAFIGQARKRRFPKKHTLFDHTETPDRLLLILQGSVSVLVGNAEGREIVLGYRHLGDFVGEMCLFPRLQVRTALVITRSETQVAEMGFAQFRAFAQAQPQIMFLIAEQLALRLRDSSSRLADLNFLDVTGRVARVLLDLARQPDAEIVEQGRIIGPSKQELGKLAGCSREMAGRVLKSLEADRLIDVLGRRILVHEPAGSESLSDQDG